VSARVSVDKTPNDQCRLRVSAVRVELVAHVPEEYRDRFERCRSLFEDYCVVAESLRHGIPVEVTVSVPPS